MGGKVLPDRINPDAIVEALVEFRFEHNELPEALLGRLLDADLWEGYNRTRLPAADIPQSIRDMDANLRYQPIFELRREDGGRVAKVGGNVVSYHIIGPYPGWEIFRAEIRSSLHGLIGKVKSSQFSRIGFRYINVFRPERHHILGLGDTNITLRVGNDDVQKSVAVNYIRSRGSAHLVTVRVATPDLVAGNVEPGYSLLCDIDVSTRVDHFIIGLSESMEWIEEAHTLEKAEFFSILPEGIIEKLVVGSEGPSDG